MVKKLEILGMELDNYTVREAMFQIEGFLATTIMNTVEAISMEMLVKAQADSLLRECIESFPPADAGDGGKRVFERISGAGFPEWPDGILIRRYQGTVRRVTAFFA